MNKELKPGMKVFCGYIPSIIKEQYISKAVIDHIVIHKNHTQIAVRYDNGAIETIPEHHIFTELTDVEQAMNNHFSEALLDIRKQFRGKK